MPTDLTTIFFIAGLLAAAGCVAGLALHRQLLWRTTLTLAVLLFAGAGLYPPADTLSLGLDLNGGTSLLYGLDTSGQTNQRQAVQNTIEVLKKRVDPTGSRQLLWREEQGGRLEIQMPLPGKKVRDAKDALTNIEKALKEVELRSTDITSAVAREGAQRDAQVAALVEPMTDLAAKYREWAGTAEAEDAKAKLNSVADSIDKVAEARAARLADLVAARTELGELQAAFDAAVEAGDENKQIELAPKVNAAQAAYDEALAGVQSTNLPVTTLRRIANRPDEAPPGEPSPREQGYQELLTAYPLLAGLINDYRDRHAAYDAVKGPLDDPQDLIRLLRDAGVLEFRIVVPANTQAVNVASARQQLIEQGPATFANRNVKWVQIDDVEKFTDSKREADALRANPEAWLASRRGLVGARYGADIYVLVWNTPELTIADFPQHAGWGVKQAGTTFDNSGFTAISVKLNPIGAREMRRLTADNVGNGMGVILDDVFLSAPTINTRLGADFQITSPGGFSDERARYMVTMLNAGSLQATLSPEPIAIRTVSPNIGADNLSKGLEAAIDAMIAVVVFMLIYYFFAGAVANVALLANVVIILGVMAMYRAAFTLPGIAGIVLTIGMCVDANVLIFERIREELKRGTDFDTSLRLGYQRALSSIVDSNITNLIVCVILYQTATVEVRGFAMTLGVGICATLFTGLFVTRTIFMLWNKFVGMNSLAMLPIAVPAVDKLLSPNIKWLGKKPLFFTFSAALLVGSVFAIVERGSDLLDIEFLAGTEVEFNLAEGESMTVAEVRTVAESIADAYAQQPSDAIQFDAAQLRQNAASRIDTIVSDAKRQAELAGNLDSFDEAAARAAAEQSVNLAEFRDAVVVGVGDPVDTEGSERAYATFSIISPVQDSRTVEQAVKLAFKPVLDVKEKLTFAGEEIEDASQAPTYAIRENDLSKVINRPIEADVEPFKGGVAIVIDDLKPAASLDDIAGRIDTMRTQPDFEGLALASTEVIGLTPSAEDPLKFESVVVVSKTPEISVFVDSGQWQAFAGNEWELVRAALGRDQSLSKLSNFTPTVARTLSQQAVVAVGLSLLAIVMYIWFRFGSLRFGLAAIAALTHDVIIALGAVSVCHYIYAAVGGALLIEPFKINLAMIAAFLTIIGYSLNDTIVLFDRIRENRGKLATATPAIIDLSINQTISRTLLTSLTTLLAVGTLYIFGGEGIRGFAFALLVGVVVGTYSSIAIASPLLMVGTGGKGPARSASEDLTQTDTAAADDPAEPTVAAT